METTYPRSDHCLPHPEIFNKGYFSVIVGTAHVENRCPPEGRGEYMATITPHRAAIDGRNTKMNGSQDTPPTKLNARYEMVWSNCMFSLSEIPDIPFSTQYLATKLNRGQETHPIKLNVRYEMNCANSFYKKPLPEITFFGKYLATRGPKLTLGKRKWLGVKILTL